MVGTLRIEPAKAIAVERNSPELGPTGFLAPFQAVEPAWLDYNGHLNMAYYNVLFDRASDHAFEAMGMGPAYATTRRMTVYVAEAKVRYVRELHAGDQVRVSFRILDHDAKRIHGWQEMHHEDGWLAATLEGLWLHIAMAGPDNPGPRVSPFPDDVAGKLAAMAATHGLLPLPDGAGRPVGIRKASAT